MARSPRQIPPGTLPIAGPLAFYATWFHNPQKPIKLSTYWVHHAHIATSQGVMVLAVPLSQKKKSVALLPSDDKWMAFWLKSLRSAYGKAPFFEHLFPEMEEIFARCQAKPLTEINAALHELMKRWLLFSDLPSPLCEWDTRRHRRLPHIICHPYLRVHPLDPSHIPFLSIIDLLMHLGREGRLWFLESLVVEQKA
ncbi:MAG: WbqC family protein [Flavobacteriales bacterium]|nr:WbqC family protein [Flavobacteriales bacterium]MDW8410718.1 WbqC family protein [Flavobacteriales bacterium]